MQSYVQRAKKQAASPDIIQAVRSSGRPRAIPRPVREKMGASLGMDFSSVKIYESPLVGQQGAQAAAMGNEIAFAPGKFNMGSFSGQALLGHELAHIGQQSRGEVSGSGLVQNSAFERQADAQGVMAARGETAIPQASGAQIAPMSAAPLAGAALQASATEESKKERKARERQIGAWKKDMTARFAQQKDYWVGRAKADPEDSIAGFRAGSFTNSGTDTAGARVDAIAKADQMGQAIKQRTDAFKGTHSQYDIGSTTNRDMVRFLTSHDQRSQAIANGDATLGASDDALSSALDAEHAVKGAMREQGRAARQGDSGAANGYGQQAAQAGLPLVGMVGRSVADLQAEMGQFEDVHNKRILSTDDAAMRYEQTAELYKKAQITRDIASMLLKAGTSQNLPEAQAAQLQEQYNYASDICEYVKGLMAYSSRGERGKKDPGDRAAFLDVQNSFGGKGNENYANFMAGQAEIRRRRAAGN